MTRQEFTDVALRFSFLDRTAVPFLNDAEWLYFRKGAMAFFLIADDATAERLWRAVTKEGE